MIERELGTVLALSIATAVPLEMLLSLDRKIKAGFIYMNLRTLYRNYHGSFKDPNSISIKDFVNEFIVELELIDSIIKETLPGTVIPINYITTGKSLVKIMPNADFKTSKTKKQLVYEKLELHVIDIVKKRFNSRWLKAFDVLIEGSNTKSLIITHYPLDLLSYPKFRQLDLLESHTGIVKSRSQWITKLSKNSNYQNLPFNILMIQLLGDRSTQFRSKGRKFIDPILLLADENHWNATSTIAKIKFDLKSD